jgi:drug/metabolite transporter (DMT)-like permease
MTSWISPADSMLFSALAFALTTVIYCTVSRVSKHAQAGPQPPLRKMIAMNIATAVTTLSFYASISMIPAATAATLQSAFGPIAVVVLGFLLTRALSSRSRVLIAAVLVLLGTLLASQTWNGSSGRASSGLGVLLAVLAGCGTAWITMLSRSLGDDGASPLTVTAHRFHASYIIAAAIWVMGRPDLPQPGYVLMLLGLGVLATSIPLYLLQVGIQRTAPFSAMLVITALPALTYLAQTTSGVPMDMRSLLLVLAIIGVSAAGVFRR